MRLLSQSWITDDFKMWKNKEVGRELQASVSLMFLTHFDVFCNVLPNRPTQQHAIYLLSRNNSSQKVFSQTFNRYTFLCVMLKLIEVSTMLHAKLLLISNYLKPYNCFKFRQKCILCIQWMEVTFHQFKTGSALTAMLSIEHSSVPRRIRK